MVQQELFANTKTERGAARRRDPDTSKQAAKSVNASELAGRVVDALKRHHDGMTTHQLADYLDLALVSVSPRMAPLVRKGLVRDSGERRAGENGRKSTVWKVT